MEKNGAMECPTCKSKLVLQFPNQDNSAVDIHCRTCGEVTKG